MSESNKCDKFLDFPTCAENCSESRPESSVKTCPAVGYQKVGVSVPVTVIPFAQAGATKTKCCGASVVLSGDTPCEGKKNGVCTFTLSQTLCIEIPVDFGATTIVGDTYVDCMKASSYDTCRDCREPKDTAE